MQVKDDGSMVTAAGHGLTEGSPFMECVESRTAENGVIVSCMCRCIEYSECVSHIQEVQ